MVTDFRKTKKEKKRASGKKDITWSNILFKGLVIFPFLQTVVFAEWALRPVKITNLFQRIKKSSAKTESLEFFFLRLYRMRQNLVLFKSTFTIDFILFLKELLSSCKTIFLLRSVSSYFQIIYQESLENQ